MSLSDQERKTIVAIKLSKAETAYNEMLFNYNAGLLSSAANRLYYSMFYASSSLLISKSILVNTHSGVRAMMNLHFFKSGILPRHYAKILNDVFVLRQESDYDDFFTITKEDLENLIPDVKSYIDTIKSIISL